VYAWSISCAITSGLVCQPSIFESACTYVHAVTRVAWITYVRSSHAMIMDTVPYLLHRRRLWIVVSSYAVMLLYGSRRCFMLKPCTSAAVLLITVILAASTLFDRRRDVNLACKNPFLAVQKGRLRAFLGLCLTLMMTDWMEIFPWIKAVSCNVVAVSHTPQISDNTAFCLFRSTRYAGLEMKPKIFDEDFFLLIVINVNVYIIIIILQLLLILQFSF